jgi:hypothetical protein
MTGQRYKQKQTLLILRTSHNNALSSHWFCVFISPPAFRNKLVLNSTATRLGASRLKVHKSRVQKCIYCCQRERERERERKRQPCTLISWWKRTDIEHKDWSSLGYDAVLTGKKNYILSEEPVSFLQLCGLRSLTTERQTHTVKTEFKNSTKTYQ